MQGIAQRVVWLLLLWLAAGVAQAAERLYLWEVRGDEASAYLFGSVHLCRSDCFPLPAPVVAAFEQAHFLAVELDPTKPGVHEALLKASMYAEGDSLDRHVGAQLSRDLQEATARLGVPSEALLRMKPWMAGTTLTVLGALRAGYRADQGIDLWFLQRARSAGKTIVEIETVEQQVGSLEGLGQADQESILAQAVALVRADSLGGYLDGLLAAWRDGDGDAVYRNSQAGIADATAAQRMLDAMLVERNRTMTQRIVRLLATKRPGFVVVGALHLAGAHSIVEMLRQRGYEVRQVGALP
jgi:hypothetical protein